MSASNPPTASPAPVKPAIRAWLSLVGKPHFQASVLQTTIPIIAASIVGSVIILAFTMPLPMVSATAVPESVPVMLRTTAMAIAILGCITRVETTVAMEFGASVQPFTNSAQSTKNKTTKSIGVIPSMY